MDCDQSIHDALILYLLLHVGMRRKIKNVLRLAFQQNRKCSFNLILDKVIVAQRLCQLVLLQLLFDFFAVVELVSFVEQPNDDFRLLIVNEALDDASVDFSVQLGTIHRDLLQQVL